jgi:hypothetical protein
MRLGVIKGGKRMADKSKFWAVACGTLSLPVAAVGGVLKGSYDALSGKGGFTDSAGDAADRIVEAASDFGADHGNALTGAAITVAARVGGGALDREVNHSSHR